MHEVFSVVTPAQICRRLEQARKRVFLAGPGIDDKVAEALLKAVDRIGAKKIRVVVDCSGVAIRLGYGTLNALEKLRQNQVPLVQVPRLRIGVLIIDDKAWVYSPTVLCVEAAPPSDETPNAIRIEPEQILALLLATARNLINTSGIECEHPERAEELLDAKVQRLEQNEITETQMKEVKQDLERKPPVEPDLSRRLRVLNSDIRILRLQFAGSKIQRKKIPLNAEDLGVADEEIQRQFHGRWTVLDEKTCESLPNRNLERLQKIWTRFVARFCTSIGAQYGFVIAIARLASFKKCLKRFQEEVIPKYHRRVERDLQRAIDASRQRLDEWLFKTLLRDPPTPVRKLSVQTGIPLAQLISTHVESLIDALPFPTARALLEKMDVKCIEFNVTEDLLHDPEFQRRIRIAMKTDVQKLYKLETALGIRTGSGS